MTQNCDKKPSIFLFTGELNSLREVNKIAERYGYGNLIAYLKMKWLDKLEDNWNLPRDEKITEVSAYPKGFLP